MNGEDFCASGIYEIAGGAGETACSSEARNREDWFWC